MRYCYTLEQVLNEGYKLRDDIQPVDDNNIGGFSLWQVHKYRIQASFRLLDNKWYAFSYTDKDKCKECDKAFDEIDYKGLLGARGLWTYHLVNSEYH